MTYKNRVLISALSLAALAVSLFPGDIYAAEKLDVALSGIEYGGSVGKLLWVSTRTDQNRNDPNNLIRLAANLQQRIDEGRASAAVVGATFNATATALAYAAVVDPEPLSKATAGIAAWGAKKAGDAVVGYMQEDLQKRNRSILAQGLKNSSFTEDELARMTPEQLAGHVKDFRIGGQSLGEALKDDPGTLDLLRAYSIDFATDIGVLALKQSQGTAADVSELRQEIKDSYTKLEQLQATVAERFSAINGRLTGLRDATDESRRSVEKLRFEVQGNTKAIRALSEISYSGWSTTQKLQAVRSGLFPELSEKQRLALVSNLEADRKRELAVSTLQSVSNDLGSLAAIAGNVGLPRDLVVGLQGAQVAATGIAQLASGNTLGAIATLTSLAGLGSPNPDAERHAAVMKYMAQQFAAVNEKLNRVIELQTATYNAVQALAIEQNRFKQEVVTQLNRIEEIVLRSEQILQAIMINEWTACHALINGATLNGQFSIQGRDGLIALLSSRDTQTHAGDCYLKMTGFLDAWVRPVQWSGQVIAANYFPADRVANGINEQRRWSNFQYQQATILRNAANFIDQALPQASLQPSLHYARFVQLADNATDSARVSASFATPETQREIGHARCFTQGSKLRKSIRDLLCFGLIDGRVSPPLEDRWSHLLSAALIGPQSARMIDTAIVLSTLIDFSIREEDGRFLFVDRGSLLEFVNKGATPNMRRALDQGKGRDLLDRIGWLAESMVFQQSLMYGDYSAELAYGALYDTDSRSLVGNKNPTPLQLSALEAMRVNPVLAHNVVLLAMRRALADSAGGLDAAKAANFQQTYYSLGIGDFATSRSCDSSTFDRASRKLRELFPFWKFSFRSSMEQRASDPSYLRCPQEVIEDPTAANPQPPMLGAGPSIEFEGFYVPLPSPLALSSGQFKRSPSLQLALAYRERVAQASIDRDLSTTIRATVKDGPDSADAAKRLALALLDDAWGWRQPEGGQAPEGVKVP